METGGRDDVESICRAAGSCNAQRVLRLSLNFFLFTQVQSNART
jgi:hypothetical protein